jgi:hypothetical protein
MVLYPYLDLLSELGESVKKKTRDKERAKAKNNELLDWLLAIDASFP